MKNGNEIWDVLGDSRKRYRGPWAEMENTDQVKNQSDCRIRYRALSKKNICYLPAGRSVWWKTVTEVLKILPEAGPHSK